MVACADFLNVSDQLASELTMEEVFSNVSYTHRFYGNLYSYIPDNTHIVINTTYAGLDGLDNPWGAVSDEFKAAQNNVKNLPLTGYNASNASLSRWTLYKGIRQAHQFIEYGHAIIPEGESVDGITEQEMTQMKAEARFFVAYYHWLLFELYGPIPIMRTAVDPSNPDLDFARNTMDECIEFLDTEFKEVAQQLAVTEDAQSRRAVPTKGVALALRAKMWLYAASKLYNGGYAAALEVANHDGTKLFPAYDASKWDKAKAAFEDFYTHAQSHYSLYRTYPEWNNNEYSADESLYGALRAVDNNDEIIWAAANNSWGSVGSEGTFTRITPSELGGWGAPCYGPLQSMVDDYFMSDGLSIEESSLYSDTGFSTYRQEMWNRNTDADRENVTVYEDQVFNMYLNREPRFYRNVMFQGRRWQIGNKISCFYRTAGTADEVGATSVKALFTSNKADNPYTGYSHFKIYDQSIYPSGTSPRSAPIFWPNIQIRYAEMLLIGAEILNEATNGTDPRIYEFIDDIRDRAGIPTLTEIKPGLSKELLAEAIRKEKRVEMVGEGCRYFDVRRWMLATTPGYEQGGATKGMEMYSSDYAGFFEVVTFETRVWGDEMYLYPIPLTEINKSTKLVQNPGW